MLHRSLITGIVLFWLVMTGLLLRIELFSERGDLLPVPISYVARLIFVHQQPSDLVLYQNKERLGNVHLVPQLAKDPHDPARGMIELVGCTGGVSLRIPGLPFNRATFRFNTELTAKHEIRSFEGLISLHSPQKTDGVLTVLFDGTPARDEYHYALREGTRTVKENSGTMAALLDDPDLRSNFPIDPRALLDQAGNMAAGPSAISKMSMAAHRGTLHFNTEDLETYVVSIRLADSLESTVHVSQLGQILAVKTFAGYDLYDEGLTP